LYGGSGSVTSSTQVANFFFFAIFKRSNLGSPTLPLATAISKSDIGVGISAFNLPTKRQFILDCFRLQRLS
jgi:hypothetical protein